jgi:hypothetical protein
LEQDDQETNDVFIEVFNILNGSLATIQNSFHFCFLFTYIFIKQQYFSMLVTQEQKAIEINVKNQGTSIGAFIFM